MQRKLTFIADVAIPTKWKEDTFYAIYLEEDRVDCYITSHTGNPKKVGNSEFIEDIVNNIFNDTGFVLKENLNDRTDKVPIFKVDEEVISETVTSIVEFKVEDGILLLTYSDEEGQQSTYAADLTSPNSGVSTGVFEEDIPVVLKDGKTLGKYKSGQIVPAQGKTFEEVMRDIALEAVEPSVTLNSPTSIQFNQVNINNILNFSYIINSYNSTVQSVVLEFRRNNSGSWQTLTTDVNATTYTHILTDTNLNQDSFNYRYRVTDAGGVTGAATLTLNKGLYVQPDITFDVGNTLRERGDVNTNITGNITKLTTFVPVLNYQIQYSIGNSSNWVDIDPIKNSGPDGTTILVNHNDPNLKNSSTINYRVKVIDEYTVSYSDIITVELRYRNSLGYSNKTVLTLQDILSLSKFKLTDFKQVSYDGISAGQTEYTFYAYNSSEGDLNNIQLNDEAPVLGAFTKIADVSGVNSYGANVTYRVYKSNSTKAFTNDKLTFL